MRADHNYKEVPADFRVDMLKASAKVGKTPSDIFNNILLGKSVFLDHGFEYMPNPELYHMLKRIFKKREIFKGDNYAPLKIL